MGGQKRTFGHDGKQKDSRVERDGLHKQKHYQFGMSGCVRMWKSRVPSVKQWSPYAKRCHHRCWGDGR